MLMLSNCTTSIYILHFLKYIQRHKCIFSYDICQLNGGVRLLNFLKKVCNKFYNRKCESEMSLLFPKL